MSNQFKSRVSGILGLVLGSVVIGTGFVIGMLLLTVPIAILNAFVLTHLWAWFVAPLGLPLIGKAQAYGLCLLFGLVSGHLAKEKAKVDEPKEAVTLVVGWLLAPLVALGAGAIAHHFMR